MRPVVFDCECFYDPDNGYTLRKMTTEAFTRDSRFDLHGAAIKWAPDQKAVWYSTPKLIRVMQQVDWSQIFCISHHAHWDHFVLNHHYGIQPGMSGCTLSMARLMLGNHISVSLESVRAHFGLAPKVTPYKLFEGKHWNEMDVSTQRLVAEGACDEAESKWIIFQKMMADGFPPEELEVIDLTVKMFSQPKLEGDIDVFGKVWTYEAKRKRELLTLLGIDPAALQSADRFAELLRSAGVEPETKTGKNGSIPAFAKTDDFMQGLLEHDDEQVRCLAAARLGIKSTLDQTRAERLGFMATRGPMPLYHAYCAAHTTRWGGGDKINIQNLKRGSNLRKGLRAPRGYKVVKADKAQIECRILNYVAEQWDVIERFKDGHDPYLPIASQFYGREITKADPAERGVGKQLELSCGYGAGADTIVRTAKRGTYGPPVQLTQTEGLAARDLYRSTHPGVVAYWKQAGRIISGLAGTSACIPWGPLIVETGKISLQGIPIWYPELHFHRDEEGEEYWRYKSRRGWVKLYGGKLVENVVQFMSRVDMSQSLLRIKNRTGILPVQLEHDAAVWLVPDKLVDAFGRVVNDEMTRAPEWLPGIPLACDINVGETM
jgi:DNA polymerase